MAAPTVGPCEPWLEWTDVEICCTPPSDLSEEQQAAAIASASEILWLLTGRQFGYCTTTVRPCRRCVCEHVPCWCGDGDRLDVNGGRRPVIRIDEILIEGEEEPFDAENYRVDDWRWLVRLDGGTWPACMTVTYTYGTAVPATLKAAAATFACEAAKRCAGLPCELPERVRMLSREGVSFAVLDPAEFLEKGLTGIPSVDLAIGAWAPLGVQTPVVGWLDPTVSARATYVDTGLAVVPPGP